MTGTCGQRAHGDAVRAYPDPKYFDSPTMSVPELSGAACQGGAAARRHDTLHVEKSEEWKTKTWSYPGGLQAYLQELGEGLTPVAPIFAGESYLGNRRTATRSPKVRGRVGARLVRRRHGGRESYVNLIPTPPGGTHEAGRPASALFESVKAFVDHHGLLPRGARLQAEDVAASSTSSSPRASSTRSSRDRSRRSSRAATR